MEGVAIGEYMVGRHHEHRVGPAVPHRQTCGECQRRRGVPVDGFECDTHTLDACSTQLLRNHEAMLVVADHDCRRTAEIASAEPVQVAGSLLQHGVLASGGEKLLGPAFARQWPEAGTGSAREDDGC